MNISQTLPTNFTDYVSNTEGKDYLNNLKNTKSGSSMMMVRVADSFLEEIDEVAHTMRMDRSKLTRWALQRTISYHKKHELPYLKEVVR